ncbi:MAG: PilZ domain-containing protein [Fimbriimonadales bacterium]|nr:PilZ domain-containing protein [Fimbriimonadales bacterium]
MKDGNVDLRRYARFDMFEYAVIDSPSHSESIRAVVVDISLGGLQIRCREHLPPGEHVQIKVGQSESKPLQLKGEVRYCVAVEGSDINAVGLRFMAANHEERLQIANYVHAVFLRQGEALTS